MEATHFALVQGWRDTRAALAAWNASPGPVVRTWVLASASIAVALLAAVWLIATLTEPSSRTVDAISRDAVGNWQDVADVLLRNSLVLALHAMACVAGFIARSSLPLQVEGKQGVWRRVHEHAGPLAVAFVVGAIAFSLSAQAYLLGTNAGTLAARLRMSPGLLLLALTPHALPELTALFLPLAAWIVASRRGDWNQLMAATAVTVGLAIPVLVLAGLTEVFISPRIVSALAP
ncbi:MAG TPA: stage II sporulation protein M [Solirubrobacteraceae bacterium]|jgi:hypothetical protein|nr:stage II sporulation protein M [Solirubrobacteraceae bacterium]